MVGEAQFSIVLDNWALMIQQFKKIELYKKEIIGFSKKK